MRIRILSAAILGAGLLMTGGVTAQQTTTPAANPLDVVPDKMPFDTPYGAPISLQSAQAAIQAAVAEATKRGWRMNIAVLDSGANLVTFVRMDGAQLASIAIAEHKARVAVKYRRPTKVFEDAVQKDGLQIHPVARRRGSFARRHSADRGWQAHRRHRMFRRHRLAG